MTGKKLAMFDKIISTCRNNRPAMPFGNRKKIFQRIFSVRYCQISKKYHPSGNLKFNYLGIFQSLKLRSLMRKILSISLKLNFTPNTLGCFGLMR